VESIINLPQVLKKGSVKERKTISIEETLPPCSFINPNSNKKLFILRKKNDFRSQKEKIFIFKR
jgi:hypothetical protein